MRRRRAFTPTPRRSVVRSLSTLALLLAFAVPALAQPVALWTDVPAARAAPRDDLRAYRLVRLDADALRARLAPAEGARTAAVTLPLPLPDGGVAEAEVAESSVMAAALQARYPQIRTYAAEGALTGRFSVTPAGVTALLFTPDGPVAIDAVEGDLYAVYRPSDLVVPGGLRDAVSDDVVEIPGEPRTAPHARTGAATGELLRTYRLAVAARGEYTQAQATPTVAGGLAAVTASVNRANAIFERDLAVRFELVADNDKIIYTSPGGDPFTGTGRSLLLSGQIQAALDDEIGNAGYDVGHLIGFDEGGGIAYLRAACNATFKGGGLSGVGRESSLFDLIVFPHELGHMLGAPHAFVDYGGPEGPNEDGVEPGPGYSMMAYGQFAGYRPTDERMGFYFHAASIEDMEAHVRTGPGACGANTVTGNDVPLVTVPAPAVTIPVGTPFLLEGSATDASPMSFVWEQVDRYGNGGGVVPLFRSVDPGPAPRRSFPDLGRALDGTPYPDETLPSRTGTYSFRLTARDGAGGVGTADVAVTTVLAGQGFALTSQTVPVIYGPGDPIEVTWDVAGTDGAPILATEVDVLLSADGGETWTVAAAATPNDGHATVTAPASVSGRGGVVMVRPTGNVFYAVSAAPFAVGVAPTAEVSARLVDLRVQPDASRQATFTISNRGVAESQLTFDLTLARLSDASGASVPAPVGYTVSDADDPGGPAVAFRDIASTGTPLSFIGANGTANTDDGAARVALPAGVPFYGQPYPDVTVLTNGMLQFVGSSPNAYANQAIPTTAEPNAFIAPFWDDLRLEAGAVYTETLADGRFVVQWDGVGRYVAGGGASGASYTFQVLLSPDGTIEVQYGTMTGTTTSATVGIETADGTTGVALGFDTAYARSDFAIRFEPFRPWLTISGGAGTLPGGASADVTLTADASSFEEGDNLSAELLLRTNDGALATLTIPVTMAVTSQAVAAEDGPEAAVVSLVAPNPAAGRAALTVALAAPGAVRATLHDVLGRQLAVLHDGPAAGTLALAVEAGGLAAGAYVVRVVGDGFQAARRLVVAR